MERRATLNPLHPSYVEKEAEVSIEMSHAVSKSGKESDHELKTGKKNTAKPEKEAEVSIEMSKAVSKSEKETDNELKVGEKHKAKSEKKNRYERKTSNVSLKEGSKKFSSRASMHTSQIFKSPENNINKSFSKWFQSTASHST